MSPETATILWALATACVSAATHIIFARALAQMGSFAAAQATNLGNMLILGAYGLWLFDPARFRWEAFAWFAGMGVINFSVNRWIFYTGLMRVGPSRHLTIMSLAPLPNLFFAMVLLGERPGPLVLFGTALVVVGVIAVSYQPTEKGWFVAGIGWSLTSAIVVAANGYLRKRGLSLMPDAALLTGWAAMVALPVGEAFRRVLPKRFFEWGPASVIPILVVGAGFNSAHQILMNNAFRGQLSLAAPLMNASPIFVLLFSSLFLRGLERLTPRVVMGVLITVLGVAAIGIGRHG